MNKRTVHRGVTVQKVQSAFPQGHGSLYLNIPDGLHRSGLRYVEIVYGPSFACKLQRQDHSAEEQGRESSWVCVKMGYPLIHIKMRFVLIGRRKTNGLGGTPLTWHIPS